MPCSGGPYDMKWRILCKADCNYVILVTYILVKSRLDVCFETVWTHSGIYFPLELMLQPSGRSDRQPHAPGPGCFFSEGPRENLCGRSGRIFGWSFESMSCGDVEKKTGTHQILCKSHAKMYTLCKTDASNLSSCATILRVHCQNKPHVYFARS